MSFAEPTPTLFVDVGEALPVDEVSEIVEGEVESGQELKPTPEQVRIQNDGSAGNENAYWAKWLLLQNESGETPESGDDDNDKDFYLNLLQGKERQKKNRKVER